jgi:hypothetical protein
MQSGPQSVRLAALVSRKTTAFQPIIPLRHLETQNIGRRRMGYFAVIAAAIATFAVGAAY